ncbi:hypothetical protein ASA1KI_10010 [Opitutales bacterium ASA1]|uniref:CD225/dispanin family protein n=1 Tax=Congregicoccus parvus TaxID=3081749 RepID=UPI002B2C555D|nr:hypothetical protein ASA1KI_10010 [Opitutales bacterium ASA1]
MNYHIARDGQQIGVFSREDVLAKIQQGTVRATDLAWTEGMADWKPVSEVFAGAAAVPAAPPAPPPAFGVPPPAQGVATGDAFAAAPPKPENYLVWSILATILCCLPLGIVSIIFAAQVDGKYRAGDYAGAAESSRKAKMFAWWSFGVGLVVTILVVVIQVFAVIGASAGNY